MDGFEGQIGTLCSSLLHSGHNIIKSNISSASVPKHGSKFSSCIIPCNPHLLQSYVIDYTHLFTFEEMEPRKLLE